MRGGGEIFTKTVQTSEPYHISFQWFGGFFIDYLANFEHMLLFLFLPGLWKNQWSFYMINELIMAYISENQVEPDLIYP